MTSFDMLMNQNKNVEEKTMEAKPVEVPQQQSRRSERERPRTDVLKKEEPFTEDEKAKIEKRFIDRFKPGHREKKLLQKREHKQYQFKQQFIIMMAAIGIFFILALYAYAPSNDVVMLLILLIGCLLCIPIGMVFGWVLIDPFMRCKLLRKTTRRNYGIVNFVGKGRKMVTRIKNFDNDLIWIKNKCWVITSAGIHELDKYGDGVIEEHQIKPENIVAITETVPVLFIDLDSMEPLVLGKEGREKIMPEELGSTLKGWIDNQMAKISFLKRTMDVYFVVVIVGALAAAGLSFMIYQEVMNMQDTLSGLQSQLSQIMTKLGVP